MDNTRTFPARIVRWVDGDTCRVDIDQGFCDWKLNREVRLYGLDTAETRTKDLVEKRVGLYTKWLVETHLPAGSEVTLVSYHQEHGKYGRVIGDIIRGHEAIRRWANLVREYAVPYGADKKERKAKWASVSIPQEGSE